MGGPSKIYKGPLKIHILRALGPQQQVSTKSPEYTQYLEFKFPSP